MCYTGGLEEVNESTLQVADTITTALGELFCVLLSDDPLPKPDQFIVRRNMESSICKITITEGAIVMLESSIMAVMFGLKKTAMQATNSTLWGHIKQRLVETSFY